MRMGLYPTLWAEVSPNNYIRRLSGIDKYSGFEINVEDAYLRNLGGTEAPPTFVITSCIELTDAKA